MKVENKDRRYKGNPATGEKFLKIAEVNSAGLIFGVFVNLETKEKTWVAFKLAILGGDLAPKANFWLSWSRIEFVFAKGRDFLILQEHYPDLPDTLSGLLKTWLSL